MWDRSYGGSRPADSRPCVQGPDLVIVVVVSVWFCFPLWKLVGSCPCTCFPKCLVIRACRSHRGLFPCIVRSSAGPEHSVFPHCLLDTLPSVSSGSSWNSSWSSFGPSGVDLSLSAFLSYFPALPFHAALWKIPRAFPALLLSLSFCFLIFNSQELFLVPKYSFFIASYSYCRDARYLISESNSLC